MRVISASSCKAHCEPTHHHRSKRMTLLQHVKFRPVLPALNEIRMTLISGSLRIASSACSRLSALILPSYRTYLTPACFRNGSTMFKKEVNCRWRRFSFLSTISEQCPVSTNLRENDGFLSAVRSVINLSQQLQCHTGFRAAWRHA